MPRVSNADGVHLLNARDDSREPGWNLTALADLQARLRGWFATDFSMFDGHSGDLLLSSGTLGVNEDLLLLGELCRAVAARGQAEFLDELGPLVRVAVPIPGERRASLVAVGTFRVDAHLTAHQIARLAEQWSRSIEETEAQLRQQQVWQPAVLAGMAQLATERMAIDCRMRTLDREVRDLTLNLSTTYEEISLIYRLTQNLKLGSSTRDLAELAIEWLADVLPAECLAVMLEAERSAATSEAKLLTYGNCPLSEAQVALLLANHTASAGKRPWVFNESQATVTEWDYPEVKQLVAVALSEANNHFGWLLAINHARGGEFGTVEASLLSSVAALLGIHSSNAQLYARQHELFTGVVRALTSSIDAKDPYTCGHSDRVARIAARLAEVLGCEREQVETIYLAGLLHDIGKIGIDDNVLRKPGRLTEAEYEHIKLHTEIGHRILSDIRELDQVLPIVLHHHEQWNGQGYPHRLAGEQIPLLARIMAVADSFDAMSSDRPYRRGMPDEQLDAIFRQGAGQQWDAQVVEAFFRVRDEMRAIADRQPPSAEPDAREFV